MLEHSFEYEDMVRRVKAICIEVPAINIDLASVAKAVKDVMEGVRP
jgi:hypothetical protein